MGSEMCIRDRFKAEDFDTENTMQQEVADFIASIRTCPPRQDRQDVLIPGDPERAKRAEVAKNGVNLSQTICDQLKQISISLSVPIPASLI